MIWCCVVSVLASIIGVFVLAFLLCVFFSSRRRHTRCALVTGVQTCALPIYGRPPAETRPIHPDVDWQASLLATKVLRRVMTLRQACDELAGWQAEAVGDDPAWRPVQPRTLIVTHMMNRLLKRGY